LCEALAETGYRFCRVAYVPFAERVGQWFGRAAGRPAPPVTIGGITCVRIGPCGFDAAQVHARCRQAAAAGTPVVLYGHPHSLHAEKGSQSIADLRQVLAMAAIGMRSGATRCIVPRQWS